MMITWIPVTASSRILAEAYDPETERIYVRFLEGVEWWYANCPPQVWEEFTRPSQSRGRYINDVLNFKPNGRNAG
jgi:hypothetical protein